MKVHAALALSVILGGCTPTGMMMMMRSPEYEAGYADGCATASAAGPGVPSDPRRNEMLYAGNPNYRRGWSSGNAQCRVDRQNQL